MRTAALTVGLFSTGLILAAAFTPPKVSAAQSGSYALGAINISLINKLEEIVVQPKTGPEKSEVKAAKKPVFVKVKKGDSLSKIARANNTTYKRLFDANKFIKDPNLINPGERIRVPFKDEKLKKRTLPTPKPVVRKSSVTVVSVRRISSNAPAVAGGSVWDKLASCESGGNWSINTGNGYYGGLQFLPSTWRAVGGKGLPHQNSREEQIKRGKILQARSGWGQWPACARMLGLL